MELLNNNVLDKSEWKEYSFDEIAFNINEKVDPNITDLQIYVGLEHLDPESIHIRRFGKRTDVKGAKLRVYPGDIIFGRRRAYQRKAATANFDGFCSAHALVLRAKKEVILPELFPFFLHSNIFMNRAVNISVGSLSPTINWGTLKNEKFLLPPKDQQEKIAELLWAADKVVETNLNLYEKTRCYFERYLIDSMRGELSSNFELWKEYNLSQLGETYSGLNGKAKDDFGSGKPFITYLNIFSNLEIDTNAFDFVQIDKDEKQNTVTFGDVFFTASSETPDEVGMSSVLLDKIEECYLNSFCFGFRLKDFDVINPFFAKYLFRSLDVRKFMIKHAQGSTRFNLSKTTLKNKLRIKVPPIDEQKCIYEKLESIQKIMKRISNQIERVKFIQKSLIETIFTNI